MICRLAKGRLNEGGVFGFGLSSSPNYLSTQSRDLNAAVYGTLREVFPHVIIVPGESNRFIASDSRLSYDIPGLLEMKGIETDYVNRDYMKAVLTPDRIASVQQAVDVNRVVIQFRTR